MFVACSTNAGKGLVKLSHVQRCTWTCGRVAHSFSTAVKQLSESKKHREGWLMSSAQSFYGLRLQSLSHSLAVFPGMCQSLTGSDGQCTSLHVTQSYQAFPGIRTVSDKCWGEKAGVWGLHAAYVPHYCDYVMVAVHCMPYTGWATTNLCIWVLVKPKVVNGSDGQCTHTFPEGLKCIRIFKHSSKYTDGI